MTHPHWRHASALAFALFASCALIGCADAADEPATDEAALAEAAAELDAALEEAKNTEGFEEALAALKAMEEAEDSNVEDRCMTARDTMEANDFPDVEACEYQVQEFCEHLSTPEGFELAAASSSGLDAAARLCDRAVAEVTEGACEASFRIGYFQVVTAHCPALQAQSCARAEAQLANDDYEYPGDPATFIANECPAQFKKLAAAHCAGRDYTALIGSPYAGLCQDYAASQM